MEARPRTLKEATRCYADPEYALAEAAGSRWPGGVACVHCGAGAPVFLKTRAIWKCSKCGRQFSFKAGTLFEDSPISLNKWLPAIWMIANDPAGIGAGELASVLGVSPKTAWFMLHRVRLAMQQRTPGT